jgi:translation initiation factor 3 subunit C
MPKQPIQL